MCFICEAELVFYIYVWGWGGGGDILANFQRNFLNPLVLMCGCLDRHIDTFLIRVSFDMHR